jgi:hypothetical protein
MLYSLPLRERVRVRGNLRRWRESFPARDKARWTRITESDFANAHNPLLSPLSLLLQGHALRGKAVGHGTTLKGRTTKKLPDLSGTEM